jgi:hypothetical protein
MLQLNFVVVEQPLEERMGQYRESALMEGNEGDNVSVARCWHLLVARYDPLPHRSSCVEQPTLLMAGSGGSRASSVKEA